MKSKGFSVGQMPALSSTLVHSEAFSVGMSTSIRRHGFERANFLPL